MSKFRDIKWRIERDSRFIDKYADIEDKSRLYDKWGRSYSEVKDQLENSKKELLIEFEEKDID